MAPTGTREYLSPPRAGVYTRQMITKLKTSLHEQRYVIGAVGLGQFLSLCLCGTGVTSQLLVTDHDISVPTTQCFLNYLLLGLTFGVYFATKQRYMKVLKYNWWKYIVLAVVDVEANFVIVLAYRYTNFTSVQLLDCFTIFLVMLLSFVFLQTRYKLINIMGVTLTLIGVTCLVFADLEGSRRNGGSAMFLGDMLCLVGALLYAAGNVAQEYLVKSHSIVEYLGLIGVVGSFVSGAQLLALERLNVANIQWSPAVGGLFSGFGVSLFLFYSLTPWVIRMSSAVVLNLSLLTADFYSLIFGIFLFNYQFSGFYIMGFGLVVTGIFIYNLKHPVEKKFKERSEERRRERSIERMFSVATTKVDSSTEPGQIKWKARGLLESSNVDSTTGSIGILSQSYKLKGYGGTSSAPRTTELKLTNSFSLSHYDSCREGPLPYWGGRHYRHDDEEDHRGNGFRGYMKRERLDEVADSGSVGLSQSAPPPPRRLLGDGGRRGGREVVERGRKELEDGEGKGKGGGEKKRRSSDSSTEILDEQRIPPANRKRRRRQSDMATPLRGGNEDDREKEQEEEEAGVRLIPAVPAADSTHQLLTVPKTTRGGKGGGRV